VLRLEVCHVRLSWRWDGGRMLCCCRARRRVVNHDHDAAAAVHGVTPKGAHRLRGRGAGGCRPHLDALLLPAPRAIGEVGQYRARLLTHVHTVRLKAPRAIL